MILCSKHIANAIHRCFTSRNTDLFVRAYCVYIRPLLEYNSVIWSPPLKCDIEAIERVQRRFTKRLPGYHKYSYSERLRLLQLPSLKTRRLQNDLIWCYKIVFGHTGTITYTDFFEFRLSNTRGRRCSNATQSVFFSERVINVWCSLPCDVTNFSSVKAFKRSLRAIVLSGFCTGSF